MEELVSHLPYDSIFKIERYLDKTEGLYFFFRTKCLSTQYSLTNYIDLNSVPLVFLHGNPHIDNYVRVGNRAGMVDFDRSRIGPYIWDIIRFTSALTLKREKSYEEGQAVHLALPKSILKAIKEGYLSRLKDPWLGFEPTEALMQIEPKRWQSSTKEYIKANKKWAKKLYDKTLDPSDLFFKKLMERYSQSRHRPELLDDYSVVTAGASKGTMGNKRFLIHLESKDADVDDILLDAKEVYRDIDNKYFYNPYRRHAHRMIEASKLYAPGVEKGLGYARMSGKEYWIREIPYFQIKLKGLLSDKVLEDFAYNVAAQLGAAHYRSSLFCKPSELAVHFKDNFNELVSVAEEMTEDLVANYETYVKKAKKLMIDVIGQSVV